MHGKVVAQGCRGHHRGVLVFGGQLHKFVVRLLVDRGPLFNPADLVLVRLDLEKAPPVLQNLEGLAVHHLANAVRNRRHAVVEIDGPRRCDVHRLVVFMAKAGAAGEETETGQRRHRKRENTPEMPERTKNLNWFTRAGCGNDAAKGHDFSRAAVSA